MPNDRRPPTEILQDLDRLADELCLPRDTVCATLALERRITRLQALRDAVIDGVAHAVYRGAADDAQGRLSAERYGFRFSG